MFYFCNRIIVLELFLIGLWVVKFMEACLTIKLLSFYKIENSKRDNLFDFLKTYWFYQ